MRNQWIKVPAIYAVLTAIYYPLAFIIDELNDKKGDGKFTGLYNELDGIFYWAHTNLIYIFSILGSALLGLFWSYRKQNRSNMKGFGIVFIIGLLAFLTLLIIACLW